MKVKKMTEVYPSNDQPLAKPKQSYSSRPIEITQSESLASQK